MNATLSEDFQILKRIHAYDKKIQVDSNNLRSSMRSLIRVTNSALSQAVRVIPSS